MPEKKTPAPEFIKKVSHLSQVSKIKGAYSFVLTILSLLCIAFIMLIIFRSSPQKREPIKKKESELLNSTSYKIELNQNLDHLKKLTNSIPNNRPQQINKKTHFISKQQQSKELLARQNAPISVYSDTNRNTIQKFSKNASQHIILNGMDSNSRFANSHFETSVLIAKKMHHPNNTIAAGEFMHATLETAINSNLPGMVIAIRYAAAELY